MSSFHGFIERGFHCMYILTQETKSVTKNEHRKREKEGRKRQKGKKREPRGERGV